MRWMVAGAVELAANFPFLSEDDVRQVLDYAAAQVVLAAE